jgi:hypothetical protein
MLAHKEKKKEKRLFVCFMSRALLLRQYRTEKSIPSMSTRDFLVHNHIATQNGRRKKQMDVEGDASTKE